MKNKTKYGEHFTLEELQEHFQALRGDPKNLSREEILKDLKGTEFDEFAYAEVEIIENWKKPF